LTKGKVIQIGFLIALMGFISLKVLPQIGLTELTTSSVSNILLILIVLLWVFSYVFRVVNGKMTFMEQRKRYRAKYEKIIDEKLKSKFNSLSSEEQEKLLEGIEEK
tara:strand:- start:1037 stop:1354 length:318 start_codon:yes stop_codon:yes gene_type:complete